MINYLLSKENRYWQTWVPTPQPSNLRQQHTTFPLTSSTMQLPGLFAEQQVDGMQKKSWSITCSYWKW